MKYNVLWLDDEFGIKNGRMESMFSGFLEDQKNGLFDSFIVERCTTSTEMRSILEQNKQLYQAVILDVFGKTDDCQDVDDIAFYEMMDYLSMTDCVVKVFSGEFALRGHSVENYLKTRGLVKDQDYFEKDQDYESLFVSLKKDLDNRLHLYQGYPELFELFVKGYLLAEDKPRMDKLLEDFKEQNTDPFGKGYIRELLQGMMERLVYYEDDSKGKRLIKNGDIKQQKGRFGDLFRYLSYGRSFGGIKNDHDHPIVPKDICPEPIKNAIQYLGNVANILEHPKDKEGDALNKPYYLTLMPGVYSIMIEVLLWYYFYMND